MSERAGFGSDRHRGASGDGERTGLERRAVGLPTGGKPGAGHALPPADEELSVRDYWRILVRRRWTIVAVLVAALGLAIASVVLTRPVFVATGTLHIGGDEPRVVKFEEVVNPNRDEAYQQTQYKLLQSRTLANRVIEQLGLEAHPEFTEPPGPLARGRAWLAEQLRRLTGQSRPGARPSDEARTASESPVTEAFLARLRVSPVPNTRLVWVSFESHDPELSAKVVNGLLDGFIASDLDRRGAAMRYAAKFLGEQMEQARAKLEQSEAALNAFMKANKIDVVGSERVGENPSLITQQLSVLSNALLDARADRIARQSAVEQARGSPPETLPEVLDNPVVGRLKEQLLLLEGEYEQLSQTYAPGFRDPRMEQLRQNIRKVEARLAAEVERIVGSLEARYRAALRAERRLEAVAERQRTLARTLGDRMAAYNLLRRQVDVNREIFGSIFSRFRETGVASALVTSGISVIDRAPVPDDPARPRPGRTLVLAGLVGLVGGACLAIGREYLDTTVKDASEAERAVAGTPVLALIPAWSGGQGRRGGGAAPFALVSHARVGSACAEAFRNLRTMLLFSSRQRSRKAFMVTSLQLGDGKTSVATNLATVLAQLGAGDVLLVDGDMRRPALHDLLGVPQSPGLSAVLSGAAKPSDVVQSTRIQNLYVVPAGEVPGNPAELMSSTRLRDALDIFAQHFAAVVFDTPPLFCVSDPLVLAPFVDGVVLVLRRGRTTREAAQRAVRALASMQAEILGIVLNDVRVSGADARYIPYGGVYGQPRTSERL